MAIDVSPEVQSLLKQMDSEIRDRLALAVEIGKGPDGNTLTEQQRAHAMQAVMLWDSQNGQEEDEPFKVLKGGKLIRQMDKKAEQANFYFKSGAGFAYEEGTSEPAGFVGLATDWETRRYFLSYENRFMDAGEIDSQALHKARVGLAPYIGDYGDLHTWVMLEAYYDAGNEDRFSLTPLVRFFKGPHLLEAGYNLDNGIMLNFVERF